MGGKHNFVFNSARKLFQPVNTVPKNAEVKKDSLPKSQKLMLQLGIIRQGSNGLFHLLPLSLRVLEKLKTIVNRHMLSIEAQQLQLSILTEGNLWKKSKRWDSTGLELFKLKDRHNKDYLLSPTHEESIADLMSTVPHISHHQLPILLYQITAKFRDEIKPRCGLLRSREFIMKDLYSFDKSLDDARLTYNNVCSTYNKIFEEINVPYLKVIGDPGNMGGVWSHEYHIPSDIGEDTLVICENCKTASNIEVCENSHCNVCKERMNQISSIEVGHTFLLGTKYSENLQATYTTKDNLREYLVMGSYGLGITRMLAAFIEIFSHQDCIRWPQKMAPYSVVIITPKDGSHEASVCGALGTELYIHLNETPQFSDDVLLDDRNNLTIGKRLWLAKCTGYPYIIVIGKEAALDNPKLELHNVVSSSVEYFTCEQLLNYLSLVNSNSSTM